MANGEKMKTTGEFWSRLAAIYGVSVSHSIGVPGRSLAGPERDAPTDEHHGRADHGQVAVGRRPKRYRLTPGTAETACTQAAATGTAASAQPEEEPKEEGPRTSGPPTPSRSRSARVQKVEQKSESDPKGALKEAEDLSSGELSSLGPQPRKALLRAAADSSRGTRTRRRSRTTSSRRRRIATPAHCRTRSRRTAASCSTS